ncbi:MAG: CapA family protein [Eubacterium sp.]|nr:CapA family protein [Eubacterium sp.]
MNEDFQDKLLEEMNRRKKNSAEREKRRRQVKRMKTLLTILCILFIFLLIAGGVFLYKKLADKDSNSASSQISQSSSDNDNASGDILESANVISSDKETDNIANPDGSTVDSDSESGNDSESVNESEKETSEAGGQDIENDDFEIKMTFVGDCCMGTNLEDRSQGTMLWYAENYDTSYFFEKVKPYFEGDDLTVANCECCISDRDVGPRDKGENSVFWFKAPTRVAAAFSDSSIEGVSLCNNHSYDYGDECLLDTQKAFDDLGVLWGIRENVLYYEKNGFTIGIVCVAYYSFDEVGIYCMPYLEEAKKHSDYQIVYFHGGTEGVYQPNDWKVSGAHAMIDAGADLVIGSHPHVLQPCETYNGVDIVYSLGNFCFGGNSFPENRTIIYKYNLKIHKEGDQFEVIDSEDEIIPCYVFTGSSNNWQPAPIEDQDIRDAVIKFMRGESSSPF